MERLLWLVPLQLEVSEWPNFYSSDLKIKQINTPNLLSLEVAGLNDQK